MSLPETCCSTPPHHLSTMCLSVPLPFIDNEECFRLSGWTVLSAVIFVSIHITAREREREGEAWHSHRKQPVTWSAVAS